MSTYNHPSNYADPTASPNPFFSLTVTGNLNSNLKNNARLDPEAIAALARGIIKYTIVTRVKEDQQRSNIEWTIYQCLFKAYIPSQQTQQNIT
ncbi:hypothetical protein MMC14_002403 [Varicellaria rhodocarpa]|nr:hypothetical protein [Varicellaria rhodocarpa]